MAVSSLPFDPRRRLEFTLVAALMLVAVSGRAQDSDVVAIAVHGGAGTILQSDLTAEQEAQYRAKLQQALQSGHRLLLQGQSSLDAVVAAVAVLEASPLFNAGIGAVLTWDETHELDASLMFGADLRAGAVAGVRTVASPIKLARAVMEKSDHVMLAGRGAEAFARAHGFAAVDNSVFTTERRLRALRKAKQQAQGQASVGVAPHKWGTVGAVALDAAGNLAAATSTGGMTAKRWGRVGDSPVIGAGTYADNRSCAVSATGHGEYFIRYNVAADICARVRYRGASIAAAADAVIFDELLPAGGTGGVIVMDRAGNIAMPFNTDGMYRGAIDTAGKLVIGIYKDPRGAAP